MKRPAAGGRRERLRVRRDAGLPAVVLGCWLAACPVGGADWPGLLGPTRDGVAGEGTALGWSAAAPGTLWERPTGSGWSGPAVAGGLVLLFSREGDREVLEALRAGSGEPVWRSAQPTGYRDDFGFDDGPRAVPEVADATVVTYGAQGRLTTRRLDDGAVLWTIDTRADFAPPKLFFGVGATPLVADGMVVAPVGAPEARAGLVAFDLATGAERWRASDHEVSYSSPVLYRTGRRARILAWTREGIVDLDPADGSLRSFTAMKARLRTSVQAATPVVVGGRLLVTASYGVGAALFEVDRGGLDLQWSTDYALSSHFATPVPVGDRWVVGFHGRQEAGAELRALKLDRGEVAWTFEGTGAGSVLRVGGDLVVLTEAGELLLAPFEKDGFRPRQRAAVLEGPVRALPAFADGVLYVRAPGRLVALDLRADQPSAPTDTR